MLRTVVAGSANDLLAAFVRAASDNSEVVWAQTDWDLIRLTTVVGPLIGTVSPMPVEGAGEAPCAYAVHELLPPPPGLPRVCTRYVRFTVDAVQLLVRTLPRAADSVEQLIELLGDRLTRLGYLHVGAPGLALAWNSSDGDDAASNAALETHCLWASTQLRPIDVVLDGACITADLSTGTQRLVVEVARHLAAARPAARVSLAVPGAHRGAARAALGACGVEVIDRDVPVVHDVVYRPYQMLRAQELTWFRSAGRRTLVNQLDMIGYSNPTYHPSADLFFLVRNLQRSMMLEADGVTFISEFGRRSAMLEVPDLEVARATVVSCGADTVPLEGIAPATRPEPPFVLVLSATFAHKNRSHAVASFAHAIRDHGIAGTLVLAGPEPFYGGSVEDEEQVVAANADVLTGRVVRLGQVSEQEKWWLLRHASAVLYPSTVEGFGLVPFEAASVGVPCLSFRGTALGEILGDGPSTVGTWEIGVWSDALAAVLVSPAAKQAVLDHVGGAAARHTWHATALATWDAIDRALAMPRRVRTQQEGSFASAVTAASRPARLLGGRAFYLRLVPYLQRRLRTLLRR